MQLIRILILLAIVWALYQMLKGFLKGLQDKPQQTRTPSVEMVRCAYCDLHVPRDEALAYRGRYYCSREHRDADTSV